MDDRARMFAGKLNYAARRMADNSEIETLIAEQHEALSWLAGVRHEIHSGPTILWNSESARHSEMWDWITHGISACMTSAMLPDLQLGVDEADYITDSTYELDELTHEEGLAAVHAIVSSVNDKIETYLLDIDRQHGTQYAPTGFSRLM